VNKYNNRDKNPQHSSNTPYPTKWNYEEHTVDDELTDCFGSIKFTPLRHFSKYVRVDFRTPVDYVLDIMFNSWHMYPPHMILSVTGGAENLSLKKSMKDALVRGISKAVLTTGIIYCVKHTIIL
jgi:hypothetical protein